MKTHVYFAHSCLVIKRKLILIEKSIVKHIDLNYNQQPSKKKVAIWVNNYHIFCLVKSL
jgi:hypothetical protein